MKQKIYVAQLDKVYEVYGLEVCDECDGTMFLVFDDVSGEWAGIHCKDAVPYEGELLANVKEEPFKFNQPKIELAAERVGSSDEFRKLSTRIPVPDFTKKLSSLTEKGPGFLTEKLERLTQARRQDEQSRLDVIRMQIEQALVGTEVQAMVGILRKDGKMEYTVTFTRGISALGTTYDGK